MTNINKIPVPLNIPKDKKLKFNEVSFVNGMSEYSLKVFIKRIWQQLMALANHMETSHSDIPNVIDRMMSGTKWTAKNLHDRFQYGIQQNFIIQYDTLDRIFLLLDCKTHEPISKPFKAITVSEGETHAKKQRKGY